MTRLRKGPPPELGAFAKKTQFLINAKRTLAQHAKKKKERKKKDRSGSLSKLPQWCLLITVGSLSL